MNYMIDGDMGESRQSPYYRAAHTEKCERCSNRYEELTEVEYMYANDGEDEPSKFINVCDNCLTAMQKDSSIILV